MIPRKKKLLLLNKWSPSLQIQNSLQKIEETRLKETKILMKESNINSLPINQRKKNQKMRDWLWIQVRKNLLFKIKNLNHNCLESLLRQPTGLKKSQVIEEEKEKQVKIEESTTIQKSVNEDVNLKYGDIVYFKFYKELSKGIISGDGIAGNKIECISIGKIINHGSDEYYKYENYDGDIDEENMNGD